uniref:Uncharacterized protein n=1 Tax=Lactuca sativa TaxID=4236 RepID=A0A9R1X4X9_LACSA|nr:hypothetical protein LSAT_V11C600319770 [Lactuca sativa]
MVSFKNILYDDCYMHPIDEFQVDHPCDCDLLSCEKIQEPLTTLEENLENGKSPSCKFWQWLDEDEGRTDGRKPYRRKPEENCNLTLKIGTLENEISICRMKIKQENNTNLFNR